MPKNQNVRNAGQTGVLRWKARTPPEVVIFFSGKIFPPQFFVPQNQSLGGGWGVRREHVCIRTWEESMCVANRERE